VQPRRSRLVRGVQEPAEGAKDRHEAAGPRRVRDGVHLNAVGDVRAGEPATRALSCFPRQAGRAPLAALASTTSRGPACRPCFRSEKRKARSKSNDTDAAGGVLLPPEHPAWGSFRPPHFES